MILAALEALRPKQWTKNMLVFVGVIISQHAGDSNVMVRGLVGFLAFSLLSGSVYVLNDLMDVQADRQHPRKRKRPIAAGRLPVPVAWGMLPVLWASVAALSLWLGVPFAVVAGLYLANNLAYSFALKHHVILDVFLIASGFVLRTIAGVELVRHVRPDVVLSPWLLVCTFFGALFLGASKRRRELSNAGASAVEQRAVMKLYTAELLDVMITVSAACTMLSYALYTMWPATVAKYHTEALLNTVPFVAYGVFRYIHLVRVSETSEDPSAVLLGDRPIQVTVLLFLGAVAWILRRAMSTAGPSRVEVTARAKLNLGLAVGPSRPDGFHDLVTVFQSVSLADTLVAERASRGISLAIRHERASSVPGPGGRTRGVVPAGADNLVVRAAALVLDRLGLAGGVRFRLVKRIPAQAGLGGGSADAAAAIAAVLALHRVRLPREARIALGAAIGSDVPFALVGGTALGSGRGERLDPLRLARPFRALIVVPRWQVSTAAAFRRLDQVKYHLTLWESTLRFASSLGRKQVTPTDLMRLGNSFERVLGRQGSDFEQLRARMRAAGLLEPRLTGSGSGMFGIVPHGADIREITGRLQGVPALFSVRSMGRGLRLRTQP